MLATDVQKFRLAFSQLQELHFAFLAALQGQGLLIMANLGTLLTVYMQIWLQKCLDRHMDGGKGGCGDGHLVGQSKKRRGRPVL